VRQASGLSVTIIGAGIAGSSAAFFARQALGSDVRILVLERAQRIGGRVRTIELGGCRVEAGAGVVHSSNRYVRGFVGRLGLHRVPEGHGAHTQRRVNGSHPLFGVWNGADLDVIGRGSRPGIMAHLLARHPVSLVETVARAGSMVRRFGRIYELQRAGATFATPQALLRAVGLQRLAGLTGRDYLHAHRVSQRFASHIVDPVCRNSYCQDAGINALACLICVAGTGLAGGSVFSVRDGNEQLCHGLLALSRAEVRTGSSADAIVRAPGRRPGQPRYLVLTQQGQSIASHAVLLCAPVAGMRVGEWEQLEAAAAVPYETVHVTFVTGHLDPRHLSAPRLPHLPAHILTEAAPDVPFCAIAGVGTTSTGGPVHRVYSRAPITDQVLDALFADRDRTLTMSWSAYPTLAPSRQHPPFRIDAGLYYANAMERTVSTLETEAVAGRNLVNLLEADRGDLAL
jgi:prenylcysteine oxidase/farnesylcysteine lyase